MGLTVGLAPLRRAAVRSVITPGAPTAIRSDTLPLRRFLLTESTLNALLGSSITVFTFPLNGPEVSDAIGISTIDECVVSDVVDFSVPVVETVTDAPATVTMWDTLACWPASSVAVKVTVYWPGW